MLLLIFIYYVRRQHKLKYTDKNNINTNTKITKKITKKVGLQMISKMAGNNELGKYSSQGITCRTVSRIFRLEPAERAEKIRAEPEMLERATPRSSEHHAKLNECEWVH